MTRSGLSFVSTANDCQFENQPVRALLAFSACNGAHQALLNNLSKIVFSNDQDKLLNADVDQLLTLLKGDDATGSQAATSDNQAVFKIKNAHGLHARPGAMLVAEAKKFESNIRVANLDGDAKPVNAKSLMKVIALGVKHGHQLQFTAEGPDASVALESIGKAISSGLGEG